jgi:hypothetical protein
LIEIKAIDLGRPYPLPAITLGANVTGNRGESAMNHPWIRIDLSRQQVEAGAVGRIRDECCRWYLAADTPSGAQLFEKRPGPDRPARVATELYFTPTMARICHEAIAAYHPAGTTDCPTGEASLLIGTLEQTATESSISER